MAGAAQKMLFWLCCNHCTLFANKMEQQETQETRAMDPKTFIENVDSWIKQIRYEFSQITDVSGIVEENVNNIQHNYELIYELKEQVDALKEELRALKLIQMLSLKETLARKH